MLRIAYIEQDSGIGGAEVNLFYLFERMDREVFYPIVIVPYEGPLTERLKELGVLFHVIPRAKLISTSTYILGRKIFNPLAVFLDMLIFLPAIWKISNLLRREEIDLVHTNSMVAHFYGAIAAKFAGVPCVWHMQDIVDPEMALGLVHKSLACLGGFLPRKIVAVSKAVGAMFDGKSVRKVQVIYNGADIDKFSPNADGTAIRKELNISGDELVVGIVGRLKPWKGQMEFLRAAALIAEKIPKAKFLVVGDTTFGHPKYKDELLKMADDLGIASRVVFTGTRNDMPSVYRSMDVLVHASVLPEPFGLVIIEGMASEISVVSSGCGGPVEIMEDGKEGFLIDPKDTHKLAEAIVALLKDGSLRKRIAVAARRKVIKRFSVETFVEQFEKLYLEALH